MSSTLVGHRSIEEGLLPLAECELAGIITTPAEIEISYSEEPLKIRTHARFDDLARRAQCPVACLSARPTAASYLEPLLEWRPDLVLVLGWYYKVPRDARSLPPLGCLGIHASLLPKYRGGAPIPWAIINGDRESGVTLFHLEEEADAGDIVAQRAFPIASSDTCADVIARATQTSIDLLRETVPALAAGSAPRRAQREDEATWYPQRSADDGRIDWRWPASRVHDFVRAQTRPYPGAFTALDSHEGPGMGPITIWTAMPGPAVAGRPGAFAMLGDRLGITCGDGSLLVAEVGLPDRDSCLPSEFIARVGVLSGQFS
jgi:methionyl-tRNA formyltransferase